MAKIADSKGRSDENSGYTRLFGNPQLGQLMSRVQATAIRTGNELENIVESETPVKLKTTLATILAGQRDVPNIQVVFKPTRPGSSKERGGEADIAIFDHLKRKVLVIELKDGDAFDTKKSSGELGSMTKFADWIAGKTGHDATYFFCSFNQDDKGVIVRGAKSRFDVGHAMTGRELCAILSIDYDELRTKRQSEQPENLRYFLQELLRIPEMRQLIRELLGNEK